MLSICVDYGNQDDVAKSDDDDDDDDDYDDYDDDGGVDMCGTWKSR